MQINPVIEALYAAFRLEIANQFVLSDDSLVVTFPDQTRAIINAQQVVASPNTTNAHISIASAFNSTHTYHYQHRRDFDPQAPALLTLQNIEDCRSYLDDVCQNLLSVPVHDFEVTFPDQTVYLITIDKI